MLPQQAEELASRLSALRHADGGAAVVVYGSRSADGPPSPVDGPAVDGPKSSSPRPARGLTVAFNVLRHNGSFVGYSEVGKLAALHRPPIQLRTGEHDAAGP